MSAKSPVPTRRAVVSGYLLKLLRESIPRSQEQMAEDLLVDRGTIQGWETGRRPFVAVPLAQTVALRHRYTTLGATTSLVDALDVAVEADVLISHIIDTAPEDTDLHRHPLGWTVMTHTLVEMLAWPVTGRMPEVVRETAPIAVRRGPVASGPVLSAAAHDTFFANLFVLAERSTQSDGPVALLRRQPHFSSALTPRTELPLGSLDPRRLSTSPGHVDGHRPGLSPGRSLPLSPVSATLSRFGTSSRTRTRTAPVSWQDSITGPIGWARSQDASAAISSCSARTPGAATGF